ncbi:MAG: hypothetical protein R3275_01930 [Saprospiraceae bacterium]|nr:hypothetical protein [Saprospiraceae bacterium]
MKQMFLLFLLPMFLLSCNGVEKYRAPIEDVAEVWGQTTTELTNFSENLNSTIRSYNNEVAEHSLNDPRVKEIHGEEGFNQWMAVKMNYMEALKSYHPIQQGVANLMKEWGKKTETLTELTEGLAAENLEGDVMGKVQELQETASEAQTKLKEWKEEMPAATEEVQNAVDDWKAAYAEFKTEEEES